MIKPTCLTLRIPVSGKLHLPWMGGIAIDANFPERIEQPIWNANLAIVFHEQDGQCERLRIVTDQFRPWVGFLRRRGRTWEIRLQGGIVGGAIPCWKRDSFPSLNAAVGATRNELAARHHWTPWRDAHPEIPWLGEIHRVVLLDMQTPFGVIAHSYDDVARCARELARHGMGQGTLFYLPGWNGSYDGEYPDYRPREILGGEARFRKMLETVHRCGARAMLHVNFWGVSETRPDLVRRWRRHQLHDSDGTPLGWPYALRTGATNPLRYLNPSVKAWKDSLNRQLRPWCRSGLVDAIFLDQIGVDLDAAQCDLRNATLDFLLHLRHSMPNTLFSGEIAAPWIIPHVPLLQLWGTPWSGLEETIYNYVKPSPVVKLLFDGYVRWFGHLGTPAPTPAHYCWTNYPWIASHGTVRAFRDSSGFHSKFGTVPTWRLNFREFSVPDELRLLRPN